MPIEFTHVPGKTADAAIPFFSDFAETATKLGLIEDGGFQKIVVDDSAGLLTNMDLAAQVLDRTASARGRADPLGRCRRADRGGAPIGIDGSKKRRSAGAPDDQRAVER